MKHLTVKHVAEQLEMSERHVRRLLADGELTYVKVGRLVRIPESALEKFLKEHQVAA